MFKSKNLTIVCYSLSVLSAVGYFLFDNGRVELILSRISQLSFIFGLAFSFISTEKVKSYFTESEMPYRLAAIRILFFGILAGGYLSGAILTSFDHAVTPVNLPFTGWFQMFFPVSQPFIKDVVL